MSVISFEEAQNIALDKIGSDCAIIANSIIEKPYGWYFSFQSKKYLETGDFREMLAGSGGFIVEKETGSVVEFGSVYSLEKNFEIYEKGLVGFNDLVILKVRDTNESVRLLNRLQMFYVEPEFAHGVEWKIPKTYNEKQLKQAISKLPCIFENQNFYFNYDAFKKIDSSKCLDYELRKN